MSSSSSRRVIRVHDSERDRFMGVCGWQRVTEQRVDAIGDASNNRTATPSPPTHVIIAPHSDVGTDSDSSLHEKQNASVSL